MEFFLLPETSNSINKVFLMLNAKGIYAGGPGARSTMANGVLIDCFEMLRLKVVMHSAHNSLIYSHLT